MQPQAPNHVEYRFGPPPPPDPPNIVQATPAGYHPPTDPGHQVRFVNYNYYYNDD